MQYPLQVDGTNSVTVAAAVEVQAFHLELTCNQINLLTIHSTPFDHVFSFFLNSSFDHVIDVPEEKR
jgi:hypothetical protein